MKDGVPLSMGGLYHAIFQDLGEQTYLCQLEIRVNYFKIFFVLVFFNFS